MKKKAETFVSEWDGTSKERPEAQSFINDFFDVFDLKRKRLGSFDYDIKNDEGITLFADFFWVGKILIEAKSAHLDKKNNWEKTLEQAKGYIQNLPIEKRPAYILLMNFKRIQIYKIDKKELVKISFVKDVLLTDLVENINEFAFIVEFAKQLESDEEKVNFEASNKLKNLYNSIERKGYNTSDIAILLARILFCLFAEDTGIFERRQFENYIRNQTNGKNLGDKLLELFDVLNTPNANRKSTISTELKKFNYVNGDLFSNKLSKMPTTTDAMREALMDCCKYDWSLISPIIFGSLFQGVLLDDERRESGSHYTSEKNILKAIKPLFLDNLWEEFEKAKTNSNALEKFRQKIASLIFLDPACGCGNFLAVTYKELRYLDIEIILLQRKKSKLTSFDISSLSVIPLHNFYGYEIDPTSAMIAEVAMWLTQHQLNKKLETELNRSGGEEITVPTIPLKEAAKVKCANALTTEWTTDATFIKGEGNVHLPFNYIVGNPPFVGKQYQTAEQKEDLKKVLIDIDGAGVLDFVTGWYIKAAKYLQKSSDTKVAFVSTNSIAQGEQTGILWNELFNTYKLKIHFAHQTFKWSNEAKGVAAVHCVIVGFGKNNPKQKLLYEYDDIKADARELVVSNINPYLVQGNDIVIKKRRKPICDVPEISFGSMPNDGGFLLLDEEEKIELLKQNPTAKKWVRPLISAHEYLNGKTRWCLWLVDSDPKERKENSIVFKRIQAVKQHRESSNRAATNKLAATPYLFGEIRQPNSDYIAIPRVSSENRKYIPFAYFDKKNILSDTCLCVPKASRFHFAVLTSAMHMAWVNYVCGRLKSDFRYSNEIVYNNFPFPKAVKESDEKIVEKCAANILAIREKYISKGSTLAQLYDESNMPIDLRKAHEENDKAVDKCYNTKATKTDAQRIEFLFNLYEEYNLGIFAATETTKKTKKKK